MSGVKNLTTKRILIVLVSLFLAMVFVFPTLVLFIGFAMTAYCKYISGFFTLIFAWNAAKLVESKYIKYLEKKDGN